MWKLIRFSLFKTDSIPILVAGPHMGENLKIKFQPNFHPKSKRDWEPIWEPDHPVRTAQNWYIHWVFDFIFMIVSINFDTRPDALWGFGAISNTRLTLVIL